jgi:GGDEF domain-containing protein
MIIDCRVLLICDDDLLAHELRKALGTTLALNLVPSTGPAAELRLAFDEMAPHGTWEMPTRDVRFDLAVVALGGDGSSGLLQANQLPRESFAAALYLVDPATPGGEGWRLRPGRDRLLPRPVDAAALRHHATDLLREALAARGATVDDAGAVAFLAERVRSGARSIVPQIRPGRPRPVTHPDAERALGPLVDAGRFLESLVERGLAERRIVDRIRACSACGGAELVFGEVCAGCGAVDFAREPAIHHFACGHVDSALSFEVDGGLVCPKCAAPLRQIGRDYERPADCYRCRACSVLAAETRIVARCTACRHACPPEQTVEILAHSYELTARANEAVTAGSLEPGGLATVLARSGPRTWPRELFIFELDRELMRHRRYATPCALLMIRLNGLAELRIADPAAHARHLDCVCSAVTAQLRGLDLISVWAEDTLAVMLPGTPVTGANVVADRMERGVATCRQPLEDGRPRVAIAIAPSDPAFAGGQQMIEACLGSLARPPGETVAPAAAAMELPAHEEGSTLGPLDSQETLVLVDDDSTTARAGR